MRIFIDIGHPAHVHYFKNFIRLMQEKEHEFFVSARERSIIHYLLKHYNIEYYNRGKGMNGLVGKLWYMLFADLKLLKHALRFKPDIFISFASPYAAQVATLLNKPHIALDDTEHAHFGQMFYKPFSKTFLNPQCFQNDFGKKQIRFNSFTELFYLHSNYFKPGNEVLQLLKLKSEEKFVLLRFVSWEANHDIGHSGLDMISKKNIVNLLLKNRYKVFVSNESKTIDPFFEPYMIQIPPQHMHQVLNQCSLLIAESGTMASEASILGTPVVYVNSLPLMGYLEEERKAGILFHFNSSEGVINKVQELISMDDIKTHFQTIRQQLVSDKIDPTAFMIWFVENYPQSADIMKKQPEFQLRFM